MVLTAALKAQIEANPTNTVVSSTQIDEHFNLYKKVYPDNTFNIPKTFDGIKTWSNYLTTPLNQGSCGSCWAFSSVSMLADRFNIQSLGKLNIQLSPTRLILCSYDKITTTSDKTESSNSDKNACYGNTLAQAMAYLFTVGTTTLECVPYDNLGSFVKYQSLDKFDTVAKLPFCEEISGKHLDLCNGYSIDTYTNEELGTPARFYKSHMGYAIAGSKQKRKYANGNIEQIQIEIYKWGPVCTAMKVYPSFYAFNPKSEIYNPSEKDESPVGGHAIEIVGWGEENGVTYWQIKNSWGTDWGIKGYFKMIRGKNSCLIEENVSAMQPDFFYPRNFKDVQLVQLNIVPGSLPAIKDILNRADTIANNITEIAGGINPRVGYTRRAMNNYPWINYDPPIYLDQLSNWSKFIAANVNDTTQQTIQFTNASESDNLISISYICFLSITVLSIIILFVKIFR